MVTYKVLIKSCKYPKRAAQIAEEIAKWSGSPKEVILKALLNKDVCIRKGADEPEARTLKSRFESVGASVELVQLSVSASPSAATTSSGVPGKNFDDDDEYEEEGRILSDEEYRDELKSRDDIFSVEKDPRLRNLEVVCMILALIAGMWLSTREIIEVATDFIEKRPEQRTASLVEELPKILEKEKAEKKKEDISTEKKKLKPNKKKGAGGQTGGGGDPRARITKKGVLGIISGQIKGKTVASADIFGKGGFVLGIDAVLSGVGGLKSGGSGGVGRKGAAGIGYGAGYGSGFGGGSGGIDDVLSTLMVGEGGALNLKKRGSLKISSPKFTKGEALTGGRSRASIMRVVMQNLAALRYAYNRRLREKPGLKGRITIKFAIDEFGNVIFCSVVSSRMGDPPLEKVVVDKIKRWKFEKIDKPGDVTEVVYQFVFSQ